MARRDDDAELETVPWLRPLVRVISQLGFPIVVALLALGVLLGIVPSPLREVSEVKAMLVEIVKRLDENDARSRPVLRQICRNTSKTEYGADQCER
jgi:hypothetical protein